MSEEQQSWGRDRRESVASSDLSPLSLVGSYYHLINAGEIVWQGLVVGEPMTGIYLIELDDSVPGATRHQRLVHIRNIVEGEIGEWRFYDTIDHWRGAYAQWLTHTQESA